MRRFACSLLLVACASPATPPARLVPARLPPPAPAAEPPGEPAATLDLTRAAPSSQWRAMSDDALVTGRRPLRVTSFVTDGVGRPHVLLHTPPAGFRYLRGEGNRWTTEPTLEGRLIERGGEVSLGEFVYAERRLALRSYGPEGFRELARSEAPSAVPNPLPVVDESSPWSDGRATWTLSLPRHTLRGAARTLAFEGAFVGGGLDAAGTPWLLTDGDDRGWVWRVREGRWTRVALCPAPDRSHDAEIAACRQRTCEVELPVCRAVAAAMGPDGRVVAVLREGTERVRVGEEPVPAQHVPCPPGYGGPGPCGPGASWRPVREVLSTDAPPRLVALDGAALAALAALPEAVDHALAVDHAGGVHVLQTRQEGGVTSLHALRLRPEAQHRPAAPPVPVVAVARSPRVENPRDDWDLIARGWTSLQRPVRDGVLETGTGGGQLARSGDETRFVLRGRARSNDPCFPHGFVVELAHVGDDGPIFAVEFALLHDRVMVRAGDGRMGFGGWEPARLYERLGFTGHQWHEYALRVEAGAVVFLIDEVEVGRAAIPGAIRGHTVRIHEPTASGRDAVWSLGAPPACREGPRPATMTWQWLEFSGE